MKRHSLLVLLVFAFVAALIMSSAAIADDKCCVRNDRGICVPCPEPCSSVTATKADSKQPTAKAACCPKPPAGCCGQPKATATQASAVSGDAKKCEGAVCVPCKPGEKCDGKPCKPGDCRMTSGKI
jgi:hypothetical protein